ncbi:MAG: glutamine synthetase III [Christensenellaceae bacterium]|jgi:glutamine synthetase|nr:glutamine synthetase III [Christensenellaceae bacterium]
MNKIPEMFGELVFGEAVMRERLPKDTYKALKKAIADGKPLDLEVANSIANAMKDWAVSKGVTHFTHWFQPMTGATAEKHDSFISPTAEGKIIMEFSGKELIKGEPDASSFPSGGIRMTFEARGYTAWDPTSFAFIKDNALCIPTAFCSYGGEALDKKTPLLRSIDALNVQALRILRLFGNTTAKSVISTVGPEQEYFLINKALYEARRDLVLTGRTLFGAKPPRGQELEDHYFGAIKSRVADYMADLDLELWKLGILSKTKHNEVAPSQHELAPIYSTTNTATDHNQLVMELMKKIAPRHGLACLLHEKPFAGINGSGKHNNWSISTDTGINLLDPGSSPEENAQFMLFLTAVLKAVDDYQDLLRASVASAGNDHRLGAAEAPPAIISVFLGDVLTDIVNSIVDSKKYNKKEQGYIEIGVGSLPKIPKDNTDRNRTSPFAFTGNKFEFRMPGSAFSIAGPNFVLNTIVADALCTFADALEKTKDFNATLQSIIAENLAKHRRIVYNGNGYTEEWVKEAAKRGLLNLTSTIDSLPEFKSRKNIELFKKFKVLTEVEVLSRYDILVETYIKTVKIEALTMIDMARKNIIPAGEAYVSVLSKTAKSKMVIDKGISVELEKTLISKLTDLLLKIYRRTEALESKLTEAEEKGDITVEARYFRAEIIPTMAKLRAAADELEVNTAEKYWPFPSYVDLLFSV